MTDLLMAVVSAGGVGALFGVIMFWVYRNDHKAMENRLREDRKWMEDRLTKVIGDYNSCTRASTSILSELKTLITRLNGKYGKG